MSKHSWIDEWNSLVIFVVASAPVFGNAISSLQEDKPSADPYVQTCKGPHHLRTSIRYTTPKGIGYKNGYTTLEGFISPKALLKEAWLPFLDGRGHIFDNGKWAANAGLGLRYLTHSRVLGMNVYYDYRNTSHQHYNQIAGGFESLGRVWDFRIQGYLPVGKKHSSFSHPKFVAFEEHSMLIKRHRYFAMKGSDAEIGIHINHFKEVPFYFAAGPYYLTGAGKTSWGGQLRGVVGLFRDFFRIEGNVSYDHFFKWIGQAQVSVNIPFGKRWPAIRKKNESCSHMTALYTRAIQQVDRHEIIPVGKQKVVSRAINPATDTPWFFWFVNNTSSSSGTYEDPFPLLLSAQEASSPNQCIYVFSGNGTTQGMDGGITLENGQMLLGAGVSHFIETKSGAVFIPPLSPGFPNITNTTGDVVTLANNNTISGFNIISQIGQNGLTGNGITNLFVDKNIFNSNFSSNEINLIDPSGQMIIRNNLFNGNFDAAVNVTLLPGSLLADMTVAKCQFNNGNAIASGDIYLDLLGGSLTNMNITECEFNNIIGTGIYVPIDASSALANLSITACQFNLSDFGGGAGIYLALSGGTFGTSTISNSTFNNLINDCTGIYYSNAGSLTNNLTILNCSFNDISNGIGSSQGILAQCNQGGIHNFMSISDCTFNTIVNAQKAVYIDMEDGAINDLRFSNNVFENITDGFGFVFDSTINTALCNTSLQVLNNTFIASNNNSQGYAASINIGISTHLCLEFINNSAPNPSPPSNPPPYFFSVIPPGTFDRTFGSDNTTNIGQFEIGAGVSAPGTCSQ
jgi:hypothetical protein